MKHVLVLLMCVSLLGCGGQVEARHRTHLTRASVQGRYTGNPEHPEINSLGLRGPEIGQKVGYRIVCIGGSTTYSTSCQKWQDAYPAKLGESLGVECINAGLPGYNSHDMVTRLVFDVLPLNPDLVVIYAGVNDALARIVDPAAYRADNSGQRNPAFVPSSLDHAATDLHWEYLIQVERGTYPTGVFQRMPVAAILDANPPKYYKANLQAMVDICTGRGIPVLVATFSINTTIGDCCSAPDLVRAVRENNAVTISMEDHGAVVYDFAADMPMDRKYWSDGVHLYPSGAAIKAELFAQSIKLHGLLGSMKQI